MSGLHLVTGGTGFLGSALVRRLVADGHRVRVLDNDWRGKAGRLDDLAGTVELVRADIRDGAAVAEACRGVETVWHLAYVNGTEHFYSQPELVLDVAVRGMLAVLDGCRAHDVPQLVLASSSEVYQTPPVVPTDESVPLSVPDPLNPRYSYGGGKIIAELMALNWGLTGFRRVMVFRPHNVYGPDMGGEHVLPQFTLRLKRLAAASAADPLPFPIQGDGSETRSFAHVSDFVEGLMVMLRHGEHRGVYHVGSTEEITVADAAHAVAACLGRRIRLVPGPLQPGGTRRRCPDIGRLAALGYAPRVPFAEGIAGLVRWYDSHSHLFEA